MGAHLSVLLERKGGKGWEGKDKRKIRLQTYIFAFSTKSGDGGEKRERGKKRFVLLFFLLFLQQKTSLLLSDTKKQPKSVPFFPSLHMSDLKRSEL